MQIGGGHFKGYNMIRALTENFEASLPVKHWAESNASCTDFQASDVQDSIDCIRQLLSVAGAGSQIILESARSQLEVLQGRRDALLLAEVQSNARGKINFEDVIAIVVASGLLKSANNVRDSFMLALTVCVKDKAYRNYLLGALRNQRHLSANSIRVNRLRVHMALCMLMQTELEDLSTKGSYMVFRTIDLTPDRGLEWVCIVVAIVERLDSMFLHVHKSPSLSRQLLLVDVWLASITCESR